MLTISAPSNNSATVDLKVADTTILRQKTGANPANLFVTDNYAATVWRIPAGGSEPKPFLQGAPLNKPVGLAKRGDDLLVADPHAKQIFVVTPDGKATPLVGGP